MTRVTYDESEYTMEISGHAGAGAPGADLVCAALTILMRTLEASAEDEASGMQPTLLHRDGYVRVQCRPGKKHTARCREMMRTVFRGYELMAAQYPENVQAYRI